MLTKDALEVKVNEYNIIQANADYCPVTMAISKELNIYEDAIQVQRSSVRIFDQYDEIKAVYVTEGNELENFMDSWERYMLGVDNDVNPFTFKLIKK
jgi:hypothetical protein|tara:strand:- start:1054 stop:1344 length:291 start_codon:yes stop_codon:yes gene_type:complete